MRWGVKTIATLLAITLLASTPVYAGDDKDVAMGVAYGSMLGFLGGGIALIWAADADTEYMSYLMIGVALGMAGGLAYGIMLPGDTSPEAAISFRPATNEWRLSPAAFVPTFAPERTHGDWRMRLNMLSVNF